MLQPYARFLICGLVWATGSDGVAGRLRCVGEAEAWAKRPEGTGGFVQAAGYIRRHH
jgi:hypothetical protein